MKLIAKILLTVCLISSSAFGQTDDFKSLIVGMAASLPDILSKAHNQKILIKDTKSGTENNQDAIIYTDKNAQSTVMGIVINSNLCYVAGFRPIINNNSYTDEGEFYLYQKSNGDVTLIKHYIQKLKSKTDSNQHLQEGNDSGYAFQVVDRFNVTFMSFGGYAFIFPDRYFFR